MIEYELFYLVGESKDEELPRIRETVEKTVTAEGGTFLAPVTEEKRKLAYPVKGEIRGTYIAKRFTLPDQDERDEKGISNDTDPVLAINKILKLSKDVLRYMILRADKLPELKPIPREERPRTESKSGRYEKRGAVRPMPAPIAPQEEKKKAVSQEEMDKQLKEKLDI